MRFWQGMVLGIAVGLVGVVLYNRSSTSTKAALEEEHKKQAIDRYRCKISESWHGKYQ